MKKKKLWSRSHHMEVLKLLEKYTRRDEGGLHTCGLCHTADVKAGCVDCVWRLHHAKFYSSVEDKKLACMDWYDNKRDRDGDEPENLVLAKKTMYEPFVVRRIEMLTEAVNYYNLNGGPGETISSLKDNIESLWSRIYELELEMKALELDNESLENELYKLSLVEENS